MLAIALPGRFYRGGRCAIDHFTITSPMRRRKYAAAGRHRQGIGCTSDGQNDRPSMISAVAPPGRMFRAVIDTVIDAVADHV